MYFGNRDDQLRRGAVVIAVARCCHGDGRCAGCNTGDNARCAYSCNLRTGGLIGNRTRCRGGSNLCRFLRKNGLRRQRCRHGLFCLTNDKGTCCRTGIAADAGDRHRCGACIGVIGIRQCVIGAFRQPYVVADDADLRLFRSSVIGILHCSVRRRPAGSVRRQLDGCICQVSDCLAGFDIEEGHTVLQCHVIAIRILQTGYLYTILPCEIAAEYGGIRTENNRIAYAVALRIHQQIGVCLGSAVARPAVECIRAAV